jgi:predicted ribosome quality control (RQC) complex YloA/Tae2 family protein
MKEPDYMPETWTYALENGWEVLAGKTDADNDLLSLRVARPNDLWFHVKGLPGSHILLRGPAGEQPTSSLIRQAAAIAAWHSKARNAGRVPVNYTEARHLSKPRGAQPGSVSIKREKSVIVRPVIPEP